MMLDAGLSASNKMVQKACERVSRPYRKYHGSTVACILKDGNARFRRYDGKSSILGDAHDADMIFEIGSITKTFTALLLCQYSLKGLVDMDAPVCELLPQFKALPDWVTPRRLSNHSSGLPRIPDGMPIADASNPYAAIDETMLVDWVGSRKQFKPPTEKMAYSNLGVGLLGLALGKVSGSSYREALKAEVLDPLDLRDTDTSVSDEKTDRIAKPHGLFGRKVRVWDFDALAGCGALKSTARDMAAYANALVNAANYKDGPLADAFRLSMQVQLLAAKPYEPDMCLGWLRLRDKRSGIPIYHHDGGTGGSTSTLFICPQQNFAVFALTNTQTTLWTAVRQIMADPMGMLSELIEAKRP